MNHPASDVLRAARGTDHAKTRTYGWRPLLMLPAGAPSIP